MRAEVLGLVDPHSAGLKARGDVLRAVDVSGPDGGAEAVLAVICAADDFIEIVELKQRQDGAELFFLQTQADCPGW